MSSVKVDIACNGMVIINDSRGNKIFVYPEKLPELIKKLQKIDDMKLKVNY